MARKILHAQHLLNEKLAVKPVPVQTSLDAINGGGFHNMRWERVPILDNTMGKEDLPNACRAPRFLKLETMTSSAIRV